MVIPVDVFFDKGEHLAAVALLLMLGVEGLDLHTPEEALRCFDEHPVGELRVGAEPGVFRQVGVSCWGWCRFVGLVVDSITTNHATRRARVDDP